MIPGKIISWNTSRGGGQSHRAADSIWKQSNRESESTPEREKFAGIEQIIVKGSLVYALATGGDISLVRDIDIFIVEPEYTRSTLRIANIYNLDHAKELLQAEVYGQIEALVKRYHLEDKPINIVQCPRNLYANNQLFDGEPELILWNPILEFKSKIHQPLNEQEYQTLKEQLKQLKQSVFIDAAQQKKLKAALKYAHKSHLYQQQHLITRPMPTFLNSSRDRLSSAIRLADIADRFDLPFSESLLLSAEDRLLSNRGIEILIPVPMPSQKQDKTIFVEINPIIDAGLSTGCVIDNLFLATVERKGLKELLHKKYPELAKLVDNIQAVGGIREFIKQEYGEAYLSLGTTKINTNSPRLKESILSLKQQQILLAVWEENKSDLVDSIGFTKFVEIFEQSGSDFEEKSPEDIMNSILEKYAIALLEGHKFDQYRAYVILKKLAKELQGGGYKSSPDYQRIKELLKERLFKESKPNQKLIITIFKDLIDSGQDLAIVADLVDLIKKENAAIKASAGEGKQILSQEGMRILGLLFTLTNENAKRAIYELLANPEIDPRLKKLCLQKIRHYIYDAIFVPRDLKKNARDIDWRDYQDLMAVLRITSTNVREKLLNLAIRGANNLRRRNEWSIYGSRREIAPNLPAEFFLTIVGLLADKNATEDQITTHLQSWERTINAIKSNKLKEAFLYNFSIIVKNHPEIFELLTEKLFNTDNPSKEYLYLLDRVIRKIDFLYTLEKNQNRPINSCSNPDCTKCSRSEASKDNKIAALIKNFEVATLLEVELDKLMVESMFKLTGRNDLTSERIQGLFKAWEDPEPIFTYLTRVSSYDDKCTLNLMAEALSQMDPPKLEQWKQWRYFGDGDLLKKQLEGLSEEQIEAYAEDQFVDLGEIIVGMLPSDKPQRIREVILHTFAHEIEDPGHSVLRAAPLTIQAILEKQPFNLENLATKDLQAIEAVLEAIAQLEQAHKDLRVIDKVSAELTRWQQAEVNKKEDLKKFGFTGSETREEIQDIMEKMQSDGVDNSQINNLARLKPSPLPTWIEEFLNRYNLTVAASKLDFDQVRMIIQNNIVQISQNHDFEKASKMILADKTSEELQIKDLYAMASELKAAKLILQLSLLSPQLIAFNRISQDKKKATLERAQADLDKIFSEHETMLAMLGRIRDIINEISHPIGKDHLAFIFTDNPIALLALGKFPRGAESCQHYENGDLPLAANVCDGMTKLCLAVDLNKLPTEIKALLEQAATSEEKLAIFQEYTQTFLEATVGRRLTKIVTDISTKQKQIFLEPVYTPLDRASMTRIFNSFAVTHLQPKVDLELVRGGGAGMVGVAASRNNVQYEDGESGGPGGGGAGIGSQHGTYQMSAQPLREAEYMLT